MAWVKNLVVLPKDLPSMTKILRKRFKMEVISPSVRVSKNGIDAEIDVLAYANSAINDSLRRRSQKPFTRRSDHPTQ